jgi:hypothetical protein
MHVHRCSLGDRKGVNQMFAHFPTSPPPLSMMSPTPPAPTYRSPETASCYSTTSSTRSTVSPSTRGMASPPTLKLSADMAPRRYTGVGVARWGWGKEGEKSHRILM